MSLLAGSVHAEMVGSRFRKLTRKLQDLLRKTESSSNSLRVIPLIARLLFGLQEDFRRLRLPNYSFARETEELNCLIIAALNGRRKSNYAGACDSYGEVLLNCYLDLFITLTVWKTPREITAKPGFLLNPATGSLLEVDVLLEEFLLGFEFQGEHHYTEAKVRTKDAFKLKEFKKQKRILIPVT